MKGRYPIQNHKYSKRLSFAIAPLPFTVSPKATGGYYVETPTHSVSVTLRHPDERVTIQDALGQEVVVATPEEAAEYLKKLFAPKKRRRKS